VTHWITGPSPITTSYNKTPQGGFVDLSNRLAESAARTSFARAWSALSDACRKSLLERHNCTDVKFTATQKFFAGRFDIPLGSIRSTTTMAALSSWSTTRSHTARGRPSPTFQLAGGWYGEADRAVCLDCIDQNWTYTRPKVLRDRLAEGGGQMGKQNRGSVRPNVLDIAVAVGRAATMSTGPSGAPSEVSIGNLVGRGVGWNVITAHSR
jgi:hypothetical protein